MQVNGSNGSNGSKMQEALGMARDAATFVSSTVMSMLADRPVAVNFDITYRCNLRCEHCYYWTSVNALGIKNRELTGDQWRQVFEQYQHKGVKNVSLTGGEPTLRMDIIEMAHRYFSQVQTATNGFVRISERVQPRGIWLSIDGPEHVHNKIRGSKTCFQRLVENYTGDKRVAVSSTITATNRDHVDDIVKICDNMGVKGVFFMLYSGTRDNPLYLTGKAYAKVLARLERVIKERPDVVLITRDMLQAYHDKHFIKECPFLGKHPAIVSYYADMTRKRCVMGDNVDCTTCSCIVPVGTYVMRHHLANLGNYRCLKRILF